MSGQGRPAAWLCLLLLLVVAAPSIGAEPMMLNEQPEQQPAQPWHDDADLSDVFFIDAQHGWAVGDRGVILHTGDSGRTWQLQPSGVECRLRTVHFVDHQIGWAAGETALPYLQISVGVLLRTDDGGKTWMRELGTGLPGIHRIRFQDPANGLAIGRCSAQFPSGVFMSQNGGRSWLPLTGKHGQDWLCGDAIPGAAVVGGRGTVASLSGKLVEKARDLDLGLRAARAMRLTGHGSAWLVGDGGLLLVSSDAGRSWMTPAGRLPAGMAEQFDFRAVEARGANCWIAGSPGTAVLHSRDGGQSWTVFPTGQNLPLHAVSFADESNGWAVGAMGTILSTNDGGRRWHVQRTGGARAAMLAFLGDGYSVPLELFARLGAADGYLCRAEVIGRRDIEVPSVEGSRYPDLLHDAIVSAGGNGSRSTWRFPLRQRGLALPEEKIAQWWDWANSGRGMEELEAHLVRQIRLWRPDVLVTQDSASSDDVALGGMLHDAVLRAVAAAGDGNRYQEQYTSAGLSPWQVKRVLSELPVDRVGSPNVASAQLVPYFGRSLAEMCSPARELLASRPQRAPQALGFRVVMNQVAEGPTVDFLSGIPLQPGGEARRRLPNMIAGSVTGMRETFQHRRNVEAILERTASSGQESAQLLGQVGNLTRSLDRTTACELLFRLASQYHSTGQWELAAQSFEAIAAQYPDDPLSTAALIWLVQYHASSEAAHCVGSGRRNFAVRQASANWQLDNRGVPIVDGALAADVHGQMETVQSQAGSDARALAVRWGAELQRRYPALMAEPSVGFPLAASTRGVGPQSAADKFYATMRRTRPRDAWSQCAAVEQVSSLKNAIGDDGLLKPIWRCGFTGDKPLLDGVLDEEVWNRSRSVDLRSQQGDDGNWPAAAMIARDEGFLYLAVTCRHAPGIEYKPDSQPRARDADLSNRDRIEICLDLDRDWATYYRLIVDHRGWTQDSCWNDKSWNPTWFVAASELDDAWTIEVAIPLDQLTTGQLDRKQPWAVGIQRVVPGAGFQSWTTPASTDITPEGFGLLVFE